MAPFIGITTYQKIDGDGRSYDTLPRVSAEKAFEEAVWQVGGIPIFLPEVEHVDQAKMLCTKIDGLIIIGGPDVDPGLYHEDAHKEIGHIDYKRDKSDLAYIQVADELKLPILGICRGLQLLNVAFGGTLYQDLAQCGSWEIQHDQKTPVSEPIHAVNVSKDSMLYAAVGTDEIWVNSVHHQAIKSLSSKFKVTSRSRDHIIEAIESKEGHHILAVQWHPELLFKTCHHGQAIFRWLILAAGD
ncbi:gamma-glutamyl-gamma-aminobutyrate hydrolase family protein [Allofustis seminis]|uniref:gamma-glutamyl-gamma-aminobutyrate hydrolase family protein n=1 Tax=Allofustis seminis TaxID=166939 RepID=UPI000375505F|nr:gamma-glutamyl-gamma-aminobutyrate hydrolase family protein [Allofustis seminis]